MTEPGALREQEQRACIEAPPDRHLCVLAGPGAGKTHVLAGRLARMVEAGAPPEALAAVTYTNSARDELRARLLQRLGPELGAQPFVGTLHQLCAGLLRSSAAPRVRILEPAAASRLFALAVGQADVSAARRRYESLALAWCRWDGLGAMPPGLAAAREDWAAYEQAMRRSGLACFGLLQLWALEAVLAGAGPAPTSVLVDEFQDTSGLQVRLLRALAARGARVMVVGDPDQAVFSFAGADPAQLARFASVFPGASTLTLRANGRGLAGLVRLCGRLRRGPAQVPLRGGAGRARLFRPAGEAAQARLLAEDIARRVEAGLSPGEVAVLGREGLPERLLAELEARGLAVWAPREERPEARPHLRGLLLALEAMLAPEDAACQYLVFAELMRGSPRTWEAVAEGLGAGAGVDAALEAALARVARPRQASLRALGEARVSLRRIAAGADPAERIRAVFRELVAPRLEMPSAERRAEAEADVERVAGLAVGLAPEALVPAVRQGALGAEEPQGRVTVASLHYAKGREWRAVYLIDLTEGVLPHRLAEDVEEERRLLFVGLSRARDELTLSAPEHLPGRGQGPSRFLAELEDLCEVVEAQGG